MIWAGAELGYDHRKLLLLGSRSSTTNILYGRHDMRASNLQYSSMEFAEHPYAIIRNTAVSFCSGDRLCRTQASIF
ncbi:unnamed protein product [Prunus armeniaca]